MSPIAHAASASLIAITFARVSPDETPYVLAALISATVLDLDHVYFVFRDREVYRRQGYPGNLHRARSVLHELVGLVIAGALCMLLLLADSKLAQVTFIAFAVHLAQDWWMGKSRPLLPVDETEAQFLALTFRQKMVIDVGVTMIGGALWILYLAGQL